MPSSGKAGSPPGRRRQQSATSPENPAKNKISEPPKSAKERIIPIRLESSGEDLMPTFTKLEDPEPPKWY